ncbi:monocarboxylate transporter 13-like [Ruditapes philippinarum]|uniref:monocarboxylate transporter 13-like n=1 Tax=Ruditapes philippinarum TaxID=129788 RepID=UPI00295BAB60|nr:monocarboxylate transporter 13-like [Ruditapes philippinarum]
MLSGMLFTAGYLGTAFAPNVQTAIFTLGFVAGCGAGVGYTSSMVVIGFNFKRKRHLALGFVLSGMGAGLFALAPLMQLARDYYGSTGFFIIQAAMALNIITFGATFFPSKLELHTQEMRSVCKNECHETQTKPTNVSKLYFKALLNKPVFFLSVGMFLNCFGSHIIYLHLPIYVVSKEFTQIQASFVVSLAGILAVVGRLITGFVANLNIIKDIWLYSGSLGIVAVGTIVYPHISSILAGHIIYSIIFGLFFGICYVLMSSVNIHFVGINFVPAAIGVELFFGGIGAVSGPVFAGILVDNGGTYEQSITLAGISIFLAALLSALTVCFNAPYKDEDVTRIENVVPESNEGVPQVIENNPEDITSL